MREKPLFCMALYICATFYIERLYTWDEGRGFIFGMEIHITIPFKKIQGIASAGISQGKRKGWMQIDSK